MSVSVRGETAYFVREDGPVGEEIRDRGRAAGHRFKLDALRAERSRQDARVARLEEALRLAREGWTCDECHGTGSYATPVHVCGGRSEEECAKRCPEAEETKCERCDVIAAALADSRSAEEGE